VSPTLYPNEERWAYVLCDGRLSDITAIWNTNAFFAYIITVRLFKLNWELRKLLAVLIATCGVMAVVYGDAKQSKPQPADYYKASANASEDLQPKAPLVGDLLTLCASVGYGLYQVLYKRHAALPLDQEFELGNAYVALPDSDGLPASELSEGDKTVGDLTYPPPFGLHPNLLACGIGLTTFFSFWILLPLLHYSGYERFRLPDNLTVILAIAGITASGLVFNVGLMVTTHSFLLSILVD
jgi:drug/metabolite transporter (DMT)-like permease